MAIIFEIENTNKYLKVVTKGNDESMEEVLRYAGSILTSAIEFQSRKILCDERNLVYEISTLDTYLLAEKAAKHSKHLIKIAIVCKTEYLKDGKFYETVASNRGLTVRVTSDIDEAEKWLLQN